MKVVHAIVVATLFSSMAHGADLRPDRVVLSSGGLAEISATVPVSGRTVFSFSAPLSQVDDVLKSLVVTGEDVSVLSVGLAGREPLADTFQALPLQLSDLENSVTLLAAMKGARVEVDRIDRTVLGMVIGVQMIEATEDEGTVARLSVATDEGAIEHVDIDAATRISVLDEPMREAVVRALRAIASQRSADERTIEVALEGPDDAQATLTYVIGAPVWKPTWRVVLPAGGPDARFQGWAVLENRTGADWDDVVLTLSSGTPVALRQALYDSVTIPRPEASLQVGRRLRPEIDRGMVAEAPAADATAQALGVGAMVQRNRSTMALRAPTAAPPAAGFGGSVAAGIPLEATETLSAATFRVPGTIDLEVGRSLTLPFFDGDATAARVSIYQPSVSDRHPVAAVRVGNKSDITLPGGIVTVYEDGVGFVGDAEFAGAGPGEERVLPYALDTKVRIAREASEEGAIRAARAVDGFLVVEYGRVQETDYNIEGDPRAPRTVLLEHIARPGWTLKTDATVEGRDGERVRIATELSAGETRTVTVTETTVDAQRWSILDAPDRIILDLIAAGDRIEAKLIEPLQRITEVRAETAQQERIIARADEKIERIRTDQERVRRNLAAVDRNGDLGRTYLRRLQQQESEMAALERERESASEALERAQADLAGLVRRLSQ